MGLYMRLIPSWSRHHIARRDIECTSCDATITAYSMYLREVGEDRRKRLIVQREHLVPKCAEIYQGGEHGH